MKAFHKAALCAALMLGLSACDSPKDVKALKKSAGQEDADAQFALGMRYDNGDGVHKDAVEAVKWFTKAAGQGLAEAQEALRRIIK